MKQTASPLLRYREEEAVRKALYRLRKEEEVRREEATLYKVEEVEGGEIDACTSCNLEFKFGEIYERIQLQSRGWSAVSKRPLVNISIVKLKYVLFDVGNTLKRIINEVIKNFGIILFLVLILYWFATPCIL
ncbi:hypothetical protein GE21DRAFT_1274969 [Neurospora crassa]|nr:hypothetical protein GE21DRAFT_1274969 [Neurospora crassa]